MSGSNFNQLIVAECMQGESTDPSAAADVRGIEGRNPIEGMWHMNVERTIQD
jgi:hypothetical protein